MRNLAFGTVLLSLTLGASAFAQKKDDEAIATENGWIYGKLDEGLKKASTAKKPLMVVVRCPP